MKSVYGKECPKHPELAGRRYVPGHGCVKCRNESSKRNNEKRKARNHARDERLAKYEALLRELLVGEPEAYTSCFYPDQFAGGPDMDTWIIKVREVLNDQSST